MNLNQIKKAYFIGIKGVGMTALAQVLYGRGVLVEGSDTDEEFITDEVLKKMGAKVNTQFSADNLPKDADVVFYSTAYTEANPEIAAAKERWLPLLSYPEGLGLVFNAAKKGIAVCGTHGKTTTSAMLGYVMAEAKLDPTVIVGSQVPQFKGNARVGKSGYVIAEADEYQNKLQYLQPHGVILTSVDYDHPDFFPTQEDYIKVFQDFVEKIPADGFLVAAQDDPDVAALLSYCKGEVISYGISGGDWQATNIEYGEKTSFDAVFEGENLGRVELQLYGEHNVLNALAVIATAYHDGISFATIERNLREFQGTKRRFEKTGQLDGALVYDDYAHLPEEIDATLAGAKHAFTNRRLVAVFQPHTFSRTEELLDEFADSFGSADKVLVLDIYSSARERKGKISSKDLVKKIPQNVVYTPSIEDAVMEIKKDFQENDLIITMGAGDVWMVGRKLISE